MTTFKEGTTMSLTATKLMLIKNTISYGTVDDLIKEIGISWYVEPPLIDEIKAVERGDGVFLKAVNELFQSIYLNKEELYLTSKNLQIYLSSHPIRNELLKLAYQRKLFEKPVMTIDFNQTNLDAFNDAFKNGSGFMQVGIHELRYLSRDEVIQPVEFPIKP
ncbi:hypothetical protein [Acinetobacter oleivorans]|uniref:hypothetical protein n=1 Tax=Acinetobacter oleivorans TaxID=1148157 RepID=UPI0012503F84|nr:hypothetical protein [Acinetobacter oleivorans]